MAIDELALLLANRHGCVAQLNPCRIYLSFASIANWKGFESCEQHAVSDGGWAESDHKNIFIQI